MDQQISQQDFFNQLKSDVCGQQMPDLSEPQSLCDQLFGISTNLSMNQIVQKGDIKKTKKTKSITIKRKKQVKSSKKQTKRRKISKKGSRTTDKNCSSADYRKNICGYVTKKIMREFASPNYSHKLEQLCNEFHADPQTTINFYSTKIQGVTGPSHIPPLVQPTLKQQVPIMKVFIQFFKWFLQERYVRHLFLQGKMEHKKAYIQYKNRQMMPLIRQLQKKLHQNTQNLSTLHILCDSNQNFNSNTDE